jgi:hypothetical protein
MQKLYEHSIVEIDFLMPIMVMVSSCEELMYMRYAKIILK